MLPLIFDLLKGVTDIMKIVVLAGGTSTEREVSLVSGREVYRALKSRGHEVVLLDVFLGCPEIKPEEAFGLDRDWAEGIKDIGEESPDLEKILAMRPDGAKHFCGPNVFEICELADVVFLALHGAGGEDGKLQAMFELNGIPYTGTDHSSSAVCLDKGLTRAILAYHSIPVPEGQEVYPGEEPEKVDFPAVVKASNGGSTVGTYFVENEVELEEAVRKARELDPHIVIESRISGREFTCGLLDGKALPLVEILPNEGDYDYKNKYQVGKTTEICPAPLDEKAARHIQDLAERAWKALHLSVYARLDFMMDKAGNVYCLEANTLPGMTPTSLIPQEAAAVGIDFPGLCEKIIEISLRK